MNERRNAVKGRRNAVIIHEGWKECSDNSWENQPINQSFKLITQSTNPQSTIHLTLPKKTNLIYHIANETKYTHEEVEEVRERDGGGRWRVEGWKTEQGSSVWRMTTIPHRCTACMGASEEHGSIGAWEEQQWIIDTWNHMKKKQNNKKCTKNNKKTNERKEGNINVMITSCMAEVAISDFQPKLQLLLFQFD